MVVIMLVGVMITAVRTVMMTLLFQSILSSHIALRT